MSEIASAVPPVAEPRRWRSIPEVTAHPESRLWWFLLAILAGPLWLIARTGGEQHASGLLWMYAGCIGVFVVIRLQYDQILRWRTTFPSFIVPAHEAAHEITNFAHRRWHLHPACIIFCVTFTGAALILFYRGRLFDYNSPVDSVVAILFVTIASYICGLGLCAVFQMTRLIRQLARFDLYVAPHPFGVLSVGRVLVRVFLQASIVWCFYTATAAACKGSWLLPSMGLAVPAILFFGISFVVAQLPLHQAMTDFKQEQVQRLEQSLRELEPATAAAISEDQRRQIDFYERRLQSCLALPEWPFRWPAFAIVIGSGAGTLLAPIISGALSSLSLSKILPLLKL